jgi:DNA-binding GntR family transcriptional regulator
MKKIPPSEKITAELRARIEAGAYGPQQVLPTRRELAKQFNTALDTIAKVLRVLEIEGVIVKGKGRSLLVAEQRERVTTNDENFRDYMLDRGHTVKVEQLALPSVIEATPKLAKIFNVPTGTPLIERGRREIIDGRVYRYSKKYYLASLVPPDELEKIRQDNTYDIKRALKKQKALVRIQERIAARNVIMKEEAEILQVTTGTAVMEQWKINYAEGMIITWASMVVFNAAYFEKVYDYEPGEEPVSTITT